MKEQQIKQKLKERYGKIALVGSSSEGCCAPAECCVGDTSISPFQIAKSVGYNLNELDSIPRSSVLGVGCGAPVNFAEIHEGEVVVDIGSGAGIDVFLSANKVKQSGKVIGIDMTDEMLEKARYNARQNGYANVEFRKGDIESRIPVDDNTTDLVISNCVINLTIDKVAAFKEIYRILKSNGGRMVISDLVTSKEIGLESANSDKWCSCIDGALTKANYMDSIRKAGFKNIEILQETSYIEEGGQVNGRKITSLVIKAVK
ncbi:MAG TPA: arsenite methyltransferase [Candidatus Nitrosopolaris sp.]|nr:arsenite methyltransferase [Candidatus Nitrosopolaris sp.]